MFLWILLAAVVGAGLWMWLKSSKTISVEEARGYLGEGALLVDVRSTGEFNAGHLQDALNLPLDQLEELAPRVVSERSRVVLLHCQSGMRSRVAQRKLNALGYSNAFNVGSYARAAEVVRS